MKEDMLNIVIMVLLVIGVVGGSIYLAILFDKERCLQSYSAFQAQYSFMTECRIIVDGKLTPVDIVRQIN